MLMSFKHNPLRLYWGLSVLNLLVSIFKLRYDYGVNQVIFSQDVFKTKWWKYLPFQLLHCIKYACVQIIVHICSAGVKQGASIRMATCLKTSNSPVKIPVTFWKMEYGIIKVLTDSDHAASLFGAGHTLAEHGYINFDGKTQLICQLAQFLDSVSLCSFKDRHC